MYVRDWCVNFFKIYNICPNEVYISEHILSGPSMKHGRVK